MTNYFVSLWFYGEVALAILLFRLLQPRLPGWLQHGLLIAISLFFLRQLAGANEFLPLAIGYAVLFAMLAWVVNRLKRPLPSGLVVGLAVLLALLIMMLFKYPVYAHALFGNWQVINQLSAISWLGLSYMTFRAFDLLLHARSPRTKAINPLQSASYLLFFLPFIAGPINRYGELVRDQEKCLDALDSTVLRDTLLRVSIGVIKIILIGRFFYYYAILNDPTPLEEMSWARIVIALYCYLLYIYFDFAGYCDVAIALARLFGIRMPENFNFPFLASNIQDSWNRWHISLSHWFRDHVFFSLMRRFALSFRWMPSVAAAAVSIFVTFVLVGAWHGDALHWILYGCYHGGGLAFWVLYSQGMAAAFPDGYNALRRNLVYRGASIVLTFSFAALGLMLTLGLPKTAIILVRLTGG